ncbi:MULTISPECIES: ATP-binding protein [unclassified Moorena]|uniref:ATP-binding protein n=1 Tax=unclassified Moorena TaxID=2683338 RepID=UPI0013FF34D9|nr:MULTISPECIES: ATP-binding protein [unclassified Moorena]NEO16936.1 ATP-binding protein [Moorena sp. SIO3E8]NEQ04037.1 ATP-binding protein [Moorena sp. SIO3F7]
MTQNPFTYGQPVPPDRFVGRRSEIQAAFDQIYNRSNLAIWGGPAMGKTSFLELLASPQVWQKYGQDPSQAVIVLLSCQSIQPFTAPRFWKEVFNLLQEELHSEPDLQEQIQTLLDQGRASTKGMRKVLKQLGKRHKFLVLLVDDYDWALRENPHYSSAEMETFVTECRSIAYHSRERRYLSMIVASLRPLNELGPDLNPNSSPWYNHYLFQSLKPFTDPDIDHLMAGIPITPTLRDLIRDIAGGHPALLQIAGSLLYRELKTGKAPDAEAFARDFEATTLSIFETIWKRCSEVEQALLMLIALFKLNGRLHHNKHFDLRGIEVIFSQHQRELTNLTEQGVIIRNQSSNQDSKKPDYVLTSSIMERWVIQELWQTNNTLLEDRQKVFLNLLSHTQAHQVTEAIKWLWQHQEKVKIALAWVTKVLAAFS